MLLCYLCNFLLVPDAPSMLVLLFISQVISSLGVIAASYRHVNYRTIAGFCVLRTFWVFEILLVGIIQSNVI